MESNTGICEHCGGVVNFYSTTAGPYRGYSNSYNLDGSAHECQPKTVGPLFDLEAGIKEKEIGMRAAAESHRHRDFLKAAQAAARDLALSRGQVTADDVVAWFTKWDVDLPAELGNAMGCIFRSKNLAWTGETTKSKRPGRHANMIKVWRYKE